MSDASFLGCRSEGCPAPRSQGPRLGEPLSSGLPGPRAGPGTEQAAPTATFVCIAPARAQPRRPSRGGRCWRQRSGTLEEPQPGGQGRVAWPWGGQVVRLRGHTLLCAVRGYPPVLGGEPTCQREATQPLPVPHHVCEGRCPCSWDYLSPWACSEAGRGCLPWPQGHTGVTCPRAQRGGGGPAYATRLRECRCHETPGRGSAVPGTLPRAQDETPMPVTPQGLRVPKALGH